MRGGKPSHVYGQANNTKIATKTPGSNRKYASEPMAIDATQRPAREQGKASSRRDLRLVSVIQNVMETQADIDQRKSCQGSQREGWDEKSGCRATHDTTQGTALTVQAMLTPGASSRYLAGEQDVNRSWDVITNKNFELA